VYICSVVNADCCDLDLKHCGLRPLYRLCLEGNTRPTLFKTVKVGLYNATKLLQFFITFLIMTDLNITFKIMRTYVI